MTRPLRSACTARCAAALLAASSCAWPAVAQQPKSAGGAAIFAANCAACHGSDGRGGERAPNIATAHDVVSLADADLKSTVENGIAGAGMPSFRALGDDSVNAVVAYLRTLQGVGAAAALPGDPAAGKTLFYGKAGCSTCHMVGGRGGFLGGDLSGFGRGRTADAVRTAILNPGIGPEDQGELARVVTLQGAVYSGLIRAEDNFSVVLQTRDGAFHTFFRDRIRGVDFSGRPLMPQDLRNRLSSKEIDDLVSFLLRVGGAPAQGAPAPATADESGVDSQDSGVD